MKVIVAGSREVKNREFVWAKIEESGYNITELVSGGARGVDQIGEDYSWWVLKKRPKIFQALWDVYGKKAGILRNLDMAKYADALIAIWDGESRGTLHMIEAMSRLNKPVKVYRYANDE